MSTDRRGRLEVPGGCLLTEEVGWMTWWMSTDRRGTWWMSTNRTGRL